jgi:hypothetical protein
MGFELNIQTPLILKWSGLFFFSWQQEFAAQFVNLLLQIPDLFENRFCLGFFGFTIMRGKFIAELVEILFHADQFIKIISVKPVCRDIRLIFASGPSGDWIGIFALALDGQFFPKNFWIRSRM